MNCQCIHDVQMNPSWQFFPKPPWVCSLWALGHDLDKLFKVYCPRSVQVNLEKKAACKQCQGQADPFPIYISRSFLRAGKKAQINNNYFCTYDLYGPVCNCFDAGRYFMWGGGGFLKSLQALLKVKISCCVFFIPSAYSKKTAESINADMEDTTNLGRKDTQNWGYLDK